MAYTDTNQIGEITEVTGNAKIIRTDGTEEVITLGTEVYQGDIVETEGDAAVNIGFIDESSFAVSNDARIAIDEFVFDPETEGGVQDFSVVRGVFMYTSGLIGRENPDQVEIDTPVGSIGIRGTIIGGNINPDGESEVSVLEGAIVVRTNAGEQLLTNQYDTVSLSSIDVAPSEVRAMNVADIAEKFSAVKAVSSSLFSSFEDQMQQEAANENVSEGLDSAEEAQVDVESETNAEGENSDAEQLQDGVNEGETLDVKPELKTMEKGDSRQGPRSGSQQQKAASNDTSKADSNTNSDPVGEPSPDIINRLASDNNGGTTGPTPETIILQTSNGLDENTDGSATAILVGTVAMQSGRTDVTYEVLDAANNPHPSFYMDATGNIYFDGSYSGDFENGDQYTLTIRALDTNSAVIADRVETLNLTDINEAADITAQSQSVTNLAENDSVAGGLTNNVVISDLTFTEVDTANPAFQTVFTTSDTRFEVQNNAGQLQLVALAGAQFDYETETSITVNITQNDGANTYTAFPVTVTINDVNEAPELDVNTGLTSIDIDEGATVTITSAMLNATDVDSGDLSPAELMFSILSLPNYGGIRLFGNPNYANIGDTFTLADIQNGDVVYEHDGSENHSDFFDFDLIDGGEDGVSASSHTFSIDVNPVNDPAQVRVDLEYNFDVSPTTDGVIPIGQPGAIIAKLRIDDPESQAFSAADFSIGVSSVGGPAANTVFEVAEINGEFYLKLQAGFQINEVSTSLFINNGNDISSPFPQSINISVNLDGGNHPINLTFGNVQNITGTAEASLTQDIAFGNDADNIILLQDTNFKFITGGNGYDLLRLNGAGGGAASDLFDFTSIDSNLVPANMSADIRSIEEIRFVDTMDTLEMNIEDLRDLLRTSDSGSLTIATDGIDGTGTGINGVTFFFNGSQNQLENHGFTKVTDIVDNGETFAVFQDNNGLGQVLIETDIAGANSGGIPL